MSVNKVVEVANKEFLSTIKGGENVGMDAEGRLITVEKGSKSATVAKPLIQDKAQDYVIEALDGQPFHQVETGREAYLTLVDKFAKSQLLTENQRATIAFGYYNQRYRDLVKTNEPWIAEATVTLEMAFDPNIPPSYKKDIQPELVPSGFGGTFFLKDRKGKNVAVFKPKLQEAGMPDNPKMHGGSYDPKNLQRNCCNGHLQGESWKNEVAATVLDTQNVIGVPKTVTLQLPFPRKWLNAGTTFLSDDTTLYRQSGSCQQFVERGKAIVDIPLEKWSKIPPFEVQKMVLFDLLCGNADRNYGNALYDENNQKLIPIDHGYILLDNLDWEKYNKDQLLSGSQYCSENFSQFIDWTQCKAPLDSRLKKWVEDYDIEAAAKKLKDVGKSEACINEFRVRALFVKEGVKKGLNVHEMARLANQTKHRSQEPTALDKMVTKAVETQELDDFLSTYSQVLSKEILSKKAG